MRLRRVAPFLAPALALAGAGILLALAPALSLRYGDEWLTAYGRTWQEPRQAPAEEPLATFASPRLAAIVRLHVIANSDEPGDQRLKLRVRDALAPELARLAGRAGGPEEAMSLLSAARTRIAALARQTLQEAGDTSAVRVELGTYDFPATAYGGRSYPAGRYQALRVVIGRGEGHNWWCVVFPPVCLSAAAPSGAPVPVTGMAHAEASITRAGVARPVLRSFLADWWHNRADVRPHPSPRPGAPLAETR